MRYPRIAPSGKAKRLYPRRAGKLVAVTVPAYSDKSARPRSFCGIG